MSLHSPAHQEAVRQSGRPTRTVKQAVIPGSYTYTSHDTNTTHTPHIHLTYNAHTPHIHHTYTTHTPRRHHTNTTHTPHIHHTYTTHTPCKHHTNTTHTPHIHHLLPLVAFNLTCLLIEDRGVNMYIFSTVFLPTSPFSQERSSEPHSDDSYQGKEENRGRSSKQSSTYRPKKDKNNKNNKKESESAPTYACAETTPSCAESTPVVVIKQKKKPKKSSGKKKEEYYTESDNSMVSVSSGLESLRDIFFDHNDSHKGYLAHYPNASHDRSDETYQSHNLNEAMSRISNPSFNSHVDLTKLSICEDVKSPEHTAPTTEVTNIEPHTNPEMLSTISEHVTQENKPPTPKLTPVRDLLSPGQYLTFFQFSSI